MSVVKHELLLRSHQVGHDNGSIRTLTRHWVTPFSAFKDLQKNRLITKLIAHRMYCATFNLLYHPENSVRAAAALVHFCLSVVTILCRMCKEQFSCCYLLCCKDSSL